MLNASCTSALSNDTPSPSVIIVTLEASNNPSLCNRSTAYSTEGLRYWLLTRIKVCFPLLPSSGKTFPSFFNKVIAFSLANGIVGFAGAMYVQYLHSYSEGIGLGMLVTALASIIIGETLFGNRRLLFGFIIVVTGSIIYRIIYAFAIRNGGANGIKLFSSVIVIVFIAFSYYRKKLAEKQKSKSEEKEAEDA